MQLFCEVKAVHTSLCWRHIKPNVITHQLGDVFSPYQTLKQRMLDWVTRQEDAGVRSSRDRFRRCRRAPDESLSLYALRLASLFNDAFPDQDVQTSQELREHLLDDLPSHAADYLRRQMHYTREIHGIQMTWNNLSSLLEREW